ncbi:c-type cytochrome [Pelagibius marinus]|uniref:c-type cytochrome n=1 Tax=Pelagibius marinus TaxID=2762760 RepID=UPI0018732A88|nr:cytochrome c [Pelagibius marinus]
MKRNTLLAAAGAAAVAAAVAFGATPLVQASESARVQLASAEQMAAVKERQELMKSIGGNMKAIVDFLKESKGTAAEAQAAAAKIGELSQKIPAAFETEATLDEMDAVGKNRGKPEIWLNWEGFTENAKNLEAKSAALVAAFEGGDSGAIQTAFGDMGKNGCGGCHDDFRGPKVE